MQEFEFKNKKYYPKFNYQALNRANELFSTVDGRGESVNNGASLLFYGLLERNKSALPKVFKLWVPDDVSDQELIELVSDQAETVDQLIDGFIEQMKQSRLFMRAMNRLKGMLDTSLTIRKQRSFSFENHKQIKSLETSTKLIKSKLNI